MFSIPAFLEALWALYEFELLPATLIAVYAGSNVNDIDLSKCPYAEIDLSYYQDSRRKVREAFRKFLGDEEKSKLMKAIGDEFNGDNDGDVKPKAGWGSWARTDKGKKKKDKIKPKKCRIIRYEIGPASDFLERADSKESVLLVVMVDLKDRDHR